MASPRFLNEKGGIVDREDKTECLSSIKENNLWRYKVRRFLLIGANIDTKYE